MKKQTGNKHVIISPSKSISHDTSDAINTHNTFPIIGIGASAGGLEALEEFIKGVPPDSAMAFVIVQHLAPDHKGIMAELLQRVTAMKVIQTRDRQKVQPNCVYVIPPNKDMSLLHGVLHLLKPTETSGLRLPIDFFFKSLAEDLHQSSIGVILSGMGSDGTAGLREIKEKGGLAVVQAPEEAKFNAMPKSVIDAGLADIVAPAKELTEKIIAYIKHAPMLIKSGIELDTKAVSALEKIIVLLRAKTGQDFSLYKKSTVYRRIERRMGLHQIDKIGSYVSFLRENPQELEILFKELMIGVTSFFRDPESWEELKAKAIPKLIENKTPPYTLRAWTPGCSTGEEAYSLAILIKETLEQCSFKIYATDLDQDAIEKARKGFYPASIEADVSPERLKRFFVKDTNGYRICKEIRDMVVFATQNLIMDPPFTKLDMLTCRNLLIYLTAELQKTIFPLFHYSLKAGGILFIGKAESIGGFTGLFSTLDAKARIYQKLDTILHSEPVIFPTALSGINLGQTEETRVSVPPVNLQSLADHLLLQNYSPPAVLVNDKGDILYINGRTGKFLEPAAGKANWNLFAMANEGIRYELSSAFRDVVKQKDAITLRGLRVGSGDMERMVDVTLQKVEEPAALRGMVMIVFREMATPLKEKPTRTKATKANSDQIAELMQELKRSHEELQGMREEMQTSREELLSTNEELQSTNEELQTTNEELTTSKEEMQSVNEEFQTVNAELQAKVDDLTRAENDLKNLLNSTDIAIVFLDKELNVRRFTPRSTSIFKLIPTDVGRPITDLVSDMKYSELPDDAREVLSTLAFISKEIATEDGRWFMVRLMPYLTLDNRIDGLVITFSDITEAKVLEAELRRTRSAL